MNKYWVTYSDLVVVEILTRYKNGDLKIKALSDTNKHCLRISKKQLRGLFKPVPKLKVKLLYDE